MVGCSRRMGGDKGHNFVDNFHLVYQNGGDQKLPFFESQWQVSAHFLKLGSLTSSTGSENEDVRVRCPYAKRSFSVLKSSGTCKFSTPGTPDLKGGKLTCLGGFGLEVDGGCLFGFIFLRTCFPRGR